jgi:hypothetical protein
MVELTAKNHEENPHLLERVLHQVSSQPVSALSGIPASALNLVLARTAVCGLSHHHNPLMFMAIIKTPEW